MAKNAEKSGILPFGARNGILNNFIMRTLKANGAGFFLRANSKQRPHSRMILIHFNLIFNYILTIFIDFHPLTNDQN